MHSFYISNFSLLDFHFSLSESYFSHLNFRFALLIFTYFFICMVGSKKCLIPNFTPLLISHFSQLTIRGFFSNLFTKWKASAWILILEIYHCIPPLLKDILVYSTSREAWRNLEWGDIPWTLPFKLHVTLLVE